MPPVCTGGMAIRPPRGAGYTDAVVVTSMGLAVLDRSYRGAAIHHAIKGIVAVFEM